MKLTRIYTGSDGESHFEDLGELQFTPFENIGYLSEVIKANNLRIHSFDSSLDEDWHNPPLGRTYVFPLEGKMEIEVSDGSKRIFGYGDVYLMDDVTGPGHRTRAISDKGQSIIVT